MEKDPYRYFRIEAREILDVLTQGILALEAHAQEGAAVENVEPLLRASHTLKGAAGVVGQERIAKLAHRLEELVGPYGRAEQGDREPVDALLAIVDGIAAELRKLSGPAAVSGPEAAAPGPEAAVPGPEAAVSGPEAAVSGPENNASPKNAIESVRLDLREVDKLLASISDVSARLTISRGHRRALARAELGLRKVEDWLNGARSAAESSSLDWGHAVEMVGQLRGELHADGEVLEAALDGAERRAHETLEDARQLRLLPAETLLGELARAVRDAAASKHSTAGGFPRVEIETAGGDIRVDAHVLGLLRDALLQLVRNAIAHGLEPEAERQRAGKPAVARIVVRFELRGPRAVVTFRDDGRGVDVEGVRAALVTRRLASEQSARAMDVDALLRIAMRRGVTTRATATELAGRGVGLQVVGTVIDRLRGEVRVRTEAGRGTEFELEVPVSVTAAPALVVASGDVTVTIPLDAVTRTVRMAANDIASSPEGDALSDEGEAVRFASLARILRVPAESSVRGDVWTAVLLDAGGARAALGVDRVLGVESGVVLSLPSPAVADPVVVGGSLDGHGEPRLALDPYLLVDAIRKLPGEVRAAHGAVRRSVLVVDDSLTSRMLERSILEAAGYDVMTAMSGEEALEIARQHTFALFVVDVEMPGMSGFEFVARTRAEPALAVTPAVLVTSRAAPEDKRRGLDVGARAYIVKGEFAQDAFLDAVRRLAG